jgi:hypothetical protein
MLRQLRELEQSEIVGFRRFAIRHPDSKWDQCRLRVDQAFARIGEVKTDPHMLD